jgi:hypothetical protein
MIKKGLILLILVIISLSFVFAFNIDIVLAQAQPSDGVEPQDATPTRDKSTVKLPNPLGEGVLALDPRNIIGNIIKALLGIVGSLALVVFILGGFTWVTAAGNEERVKKGKDMVMWAVLGLAVIFMSYVLINFVIDALTGGG